MNWDVLKCEQSIKVAYVSGPACSGSTDQWTGAVLGEVVRLLNSCVTPVSNTRLDGPTTIHVLNHIDRRPVHNTTNSPSSLYPHSPEGVSGLTPMTHLSEIGRVNRCYVVRDSDIRWDKKTHSAVECAVLHTPAVNIQRQIHLSWYFIQGASKYFLWKN